MSNSETSTMPEHRRTAFLQRAAMRLRGDAPGVTIATLAREQMALARALLDPAFASAMAEAYRQQLAQENPNEAYAMPLAEAQRAMDGIRLRRAADAEQFAAMLGAPDIATTLQASSAKASAANQDDAIPPAKQQEILRRLVQETDPDGPESNIHVAAAALGQQQVHRALANMFAPEGPLAQPLAQAIGRAAPELNTAQCQVAAQEWLHARALPAAAVAAALRPDGALYQQAMARAEQLPVASGLKAHLNSSTALTPFQREQQKTRQQKAEDVIYTLNHALTCLSVTDIVIAPALGAFSEKWFGKRLDACGHDHAHPEHHGHGSHAQERTPLLKRISSWVVGEVVGDVGAVPVTIAVQRWAPGLMDGIRRLLEPLAGGLMRHSANRAAHHWGEKHGLSADSQAVVEHAQQLYDYEMRHLPQMALWTASSIGINFGVMKWIDRSMPLGTFIKGKALGAGITASLVLGARSLSPEWAHQWDSTAGKHVVVPITKRLGALVGVSDQDVEQFSQRREGNLGATASSWSQRVRERNASTPAVGA